MRNDIMQGPSLAFWKKLDHNTISGPYRRQRTATFCSATIQFRVLKVKHCHTHCNKALCLRIPSEGYANKGTSVIN